MRFLVVAAAALCISGPVLSQSDSEQLAKQAAYDGKRGNYKAAAQDYRQLLQTGADSPELRSNLGMMLYLSGDDQGALKELRIALSGNPELVAANLFAGLSLIRLVRPREALPFLGKAEREQPTAVAPLLALGRANVALRDLPRAREAYKKATGLNPANAEAWYGLGITSRELADQTLHRLTDNGQSTSAAKASPQAVIARQDLAEAEHALSRAMALDPDSTHAHMILGEAFRAAGQINQSVQEYQAILKTKPDYAPAYLGLANTYWKFGRAPETTASLKKLLALSPGDPEGNAIMASLLVSEHQMQQAKPFAERALARRPDLSVAHMSLAKIYLSDDEPSKALPELEEAAPDDVDGSYHYILAETLRKLGQTKEAAIALQRSRQLRQSQAPQDTQ